MYGNPTGFWAKLDSNEDGEIEQWHPLLAHCADVAATTEMLLKHTILADRIARLIGWKNLTQSHIERLCVLAAIHDAGKVNHGFQNRAFQHKQPRAGHVSPIIEAMESEDARSLLTPLKINSIMEWFPSVLAMKYFLLATFSHHGRPVPPKGIYKSQLWQEDNQRSPLKELHKIGDTLDQWYPQAFKSDTQSFPDSPVLQHTFNGVLTLADWMGSDPRFFEFADHMNKYIRRARNRAKRAVKSLHLNPTADRGSLGQEPITFDAISPYTPYSIQQECMELPSFNQGSLTTLESDTGSGKTEAALARFIRLYQGGYVDGMYFAVPTRSAATQLHRRVVKAMKRCFPKSEQRPPVVQAVSGYIKVDSMEGKPLPSFDVQWPDDPNDILQQRGWAAEHPKRYLAGPIVVGTIDQVLLSSLEVNHAHMRAAALLRHFIVVDEVHASDTYMTALLEQVLNYHLSSGGHALLMSATLGSSTRNRLTTPELDPPSPETAKQTGYPLITHTDSSREESSYIEATSSDQQKSVQPLIEVIAQDPQAVSHKALELAQSGARVLIIRNRVADCLATQQALEREANGHEHLLFKVGQTIAPHHSRYAPEDRRRLDEAIEDTFGEEASREPVIATATQTVEQSLDIDADVLISDLCPIDVLLQRIGRLHRHKRDRPKGFKQARCHILTPENRDLSTFIVDDGRGLNGPNGLGTVYRDLRILEATWRLIEDSDDPWRIPADNRRLVEQGTHPQNLRNIVSESGGKWNSHQQHIVGQHWADHQLSDLASIDRTKPFGESGFADQLSKVKTRLGLDNYTLYLPEPIEGPFGEPVEQLTLSEWQMEDMPEDTNIAGENIASDEKGFLFSFNRHRFRYDRYGLSAVT